MSGRLARGKHIIRSCVQNISIAAALISLVLVMEGCRRSGYSNVICAIPRDPSGSLYVTQHAGMAHSAARLGMKVYWNGPRGGDDTQQQIELMERAIQRRDAGIVITPTAAFALDTVIQRALTDKIPVVIFGPPIPFPSDPNLTFVITDLEQSARLAANRICLSSRKPGNIAIIGIDPVTPGGTTLTSSFEKALSACNPIVHVVSKVGGASTFGQSQTTATRILLDHPDLTAIYSLSSVGTRGAVVALKALHRTDSVRIVSNDPNLDLVLLLRRGAVDALVFPNMRAMGEKSVENIVAMRKHIPVQPVALFTPVLVTRENVDSEAIQTLLKMDWRESAP
jgi:ribose transport system substrate-binding protein